jgi:TRAP-type C4-dicarboxylate transport system permease small subunit
VPAPRNAFLALVSRVLGVANNAVWRMSMLALLATSGVLTYSVISRYFFKQATDWQDEVSVFMLVGAMFLCTGHVQAERGHVGIEALASILPAGVNRVRLVFVDLVSAMFCCFFSWKTWTLFHEAWSEGQTTSSSWAPPLWIPYGLMGVGMTLLAVQVLVQFATHVTGGERS